MPGKLNSSASEVSPEGEKKCPRCETTKPLFKFSADRTKRLGVTSYCKECSSKNCQAWHEANADRVKATNAKWYAANIDRAKAYGKARRDAADKDAVRAYNKAYREANRNHLVVYERERYKANPVTRTAASKEWRKANPERRSETDRAYYADNATAMREKASEWRGDNRVLDRRYKKEWSDKYPEKVKDSARHSRKRQSENLADSYVKHLLIKNTTLSTKDIPDSMIQLQREKIANKRVLRELTSTLAELLKK